MPVRDADALRTLIDGGSNDRLRSVCTLLGLSIQGMLVEGQPVGGCGRSALGSV